MNAYERRQCQIRHLLEQLICNRHFKTFYIIIAKKNIINHITRLTNKFSRELYVPKLFTLNRYGPRAYKERGVSLYTRRRV